MDNKKFINNKHFKYEKYDKRQKVATSGGTGGHYHKYYEVYYLLEGTCWYFIDKKSYHLSAGDIALIPEGVIHKTSYETPEHSRNIFWCDSFYLPESAATELSTISYFAKNEKYSETINTLFDRIEKEYSSPDEFSEDALKAIICELLLLIVRAGRVSENKKEESPIVEKAAKYIRTHYAEDISLADAATYCYVSKEHLSRTFKKETGFGFNEYLTAFRLKKAETLIKTLPRLKVSEVALSCGFNDSNYFSKVYKKMYGRSPTEDKKK